MRSLHRPQEPRILVEKKAKWTEQFVRKRAAESGVRPSSSKYGHKEIRERLDQMSHGKCFYCERLVKREMEAEVDHHIECSERPDLAFEWSNLYLSCAGCNGRKKSNSHIPTVDCIDPCDPEVDPADHLTFGDECIVPRDGSTRGRKTVAKYALSRADLDYVRAQALLRFRKVLDELRRRQIADGGRILSEDEQAILRAYAADETPFSLMFRVHLAFIPGIFHDAAPPACLKPGTTR